MPIPRPTLVNCKENYNLTGDGVGEFAKISEGEKRRDLNLFCIGLYLLGCVYCFDFYVAGSFRPQAFFFLQKMVILAFMLNPLLKFLSLIDFLSLKVRFMYLLVQDYISNFWFDLVCFDLYFLYYYVKFANLGTIKSLVFVHLRVVHFPVFGNEK